MSESSGAGGAVSGHVADHDIVVGVVGVGAMGEPVAARLLHAGFAVVTTDRSDDRAARLALGGAEVAGDAAAVGRRADVVLTWLPDPVATAAVYDQLASVARPGQCFVEHGTVGPDLARRCSAAVAATGARYLDAPVSGGVEGATRGTLTVMAGGPEAVLAAIAPVVDAYSAKVVRCGEVGAGQAMKLLNQLLVAVHSAAGAEMAAFARRLGIDLDLAAEVFSDSYASSRMLARNLHRVIAGDFTPTTPVSVIRKDLSLIGAAAGATDFPLNLGTFVATLYDRATAAGLGPLDMAALVRLWEDDASPTE
jgi:3-hydroxyisobutyrate dehydrogenase-like beta-hydroxyacid dehydrogenase